MVEVPIGLFLTQSLVIGRCSDSEVAKLRETLEANEYHPIWETKYGEPG